MRYMLRDDPAGLKFNSPFVSTAALASYTSAADLFIVCNFLPGQKHSVNFMEKTITDVCPS
jgi:hypothetical protein